MLETNVYQLPRTDTNTMLCILYILFLTLSTFCMYTQIFYYRKVQIFIIPIFTTIPNCHIYLFNSMYSNVKVTFIR
jgi:hypothetical protein